MKKLSAFMAFILATACLLAGCGAPQESAPDSSQLPEVQLDLHFTLVLPMVPTEAWTQVQRGFVDACHIYTIDYEIAMPSLPMDVGQIDRLLLDAVESGSDGLLFYPVSDEPAALKTVESAGVPYVCLARDLPGTGRLASVLTNPESCGATLAQTVLAYRQAPVYLMAGDFENNSFAQAASLALEEGLGEPAAKVDTNDAQRTQELCEEALSDYATINTIVCFNEFGAEQARLAAENIGRSDLSIVGYGINDETLAGLESGAITAAVCPNYYKAGYDAVCALFQYHGGRLTPGQQPFEAGVFVVTADNRDTYQEEMCNAAGLVPPQPEPVPENAPSQ